MRFVINSILLVVILLAFCTCTNAQRRNSDVINSLKFPQFSRKMNLSCCTTSILVSDSVKKDGRDAIRFELNKSDKKIAGSKRSELVVSETEKTPNVERWYKFSIYLPQSYKADPVDEVLAQWYPVPDRNLGETANRLPPIMLQTMNNNWIVRTRYSAAPVTTKEIFDGQRTDTLSKFVVSKWTTFVFHIKFSYSNNGILQIWKDGQLVLDYDGPNYYNDKYGPYLKIGIYKPMWLKAGLVSTVKRRVVYFSDVVVQDTKPDLN